MGLRIRNGVNGINRPSLKPHCAWVPILHPCDGASRERPFILLCNSGPKMGCLFKNPSSCN